MPKAFSTMTNEQKAKELANYIEFGNWGTLNPDAYRAAIKMAEWKDSQLKQLLSEHMEHATGQRLEAFMDLYRELFE